MISELEYSNGAEIPSSSCETELESAQRSSHLTFLAIGSDYEMSPLTSVSPQMPQFTVVVFIKTNNEIQLT